MEMKKMYVLVVLLCAAFVAARADDAASDADARAARQAEARAKRMIAQAVEIAGEGDAQRSVGLLEAVPKMFPKSELRFKAWLELGRIRLEKGNGEEALAALRQAAGAKDAAVAAEACLLQARAHRSAGRDSEASMLLRRITLEYPDSPFANDAWFEIGQIHFDARRWARAQEAFRRVGTAVPGASGAHASAVFAEAGHRFFVTVDDRDLAVAESLGEKVTVRAAAASGDVETLVLEPFGSDRSHGLASVPTTPAPSKPEDGVLTVVGGDEVTVTYVDAADSSGRNGRKVVAVAKMVSSAILSVMDGAGRQPLKGVFAGSPALVRLRDLDRDATPQADSVTVEAVSYRRREKGVKDAMDAEEGGEGPEAFEKVGACRLSLRETGPRTGVFEGRLTPVVDREAQRAGEVSAVPEGKIVVSCTDEVHAQGTGPCTVEAEVAVLSGGSLAPRSIVSSASDPAMQGRKLLLEARLLRKWGGIFKEVGLDAQASAKADEGLQRIEEVFDLSRRQAVPRDVVENAYAAKWELLLVKGELDRAIGVCRELLRAYPDTVLADAALMGIAAIRAESDEIPKLAEAAKIYRSILAMPASANKAEAQFRLAGVLEKQARLRPALDGSIDLGPALAAYRACAENHPQSSFAGEAFKRIVTWQIERKSFDQAVETLNRVFEDYPDAPWLDEMLLRWGVVSYRRGDTADAAARFRRVLEEYPSGQAAAQARSFLDRMGGK